MRSASVLAELGSIESSLKCGEVATHIAQGVTPRCTLAHGSRLEAFIAEAHALAGRNVDGRDTSEEAAKAYSLFKRLGFEWRAARMATVLYRITHQHRWQERALRHLGHYPKGAFPRLLLFGILTQREREILALMRNGDKVSAIGERLDLRESTVRSHVRNIYRKFGARNYAQLLSKAV
jgi:DNA-binding NarL/FixJ family response regulator